MGSGAFPLQRPYDNDAERLAAAADALKVVRDAWYEDTYSGDSGGGQFDNAASDGGYLTRLSITESLIRDCFQEQTPAAPPVAAAATTKGGASHTE